MTDESLKGKDTPETPWKNITNSSRTSSKSHPPIYLVKNSHWIIPNDVFLKIRARFTTVSGMEMIPNSSLSADPGFHIRSWQVVSENGGLVGGDRNIGLVWDNDGT
jgi:hypothetical protein